MAVLRLELTTPGLKSDYKWHLETRFSDFMFGVVLDNFMVLLKPVTARTIFLSWCIFINK